MGPLSDAFLQWCHATIDFYNSGSSHEQEENIKRMQAAFNAMHGVDTSELSSDDKEVLKWISAISDLYGKKWVE